MGFNRFPSRIHPGHLHALHAASHHPEHPHHPHPGEPGGPGFPPMMMRGRGGRVRAPRGDVRYAVLLLLAEEPMHGYQLMQAISDRSGGRWSPSPGAIYPTISQLEDEGLVAVREDAGRKLVSLTEVGREWVESQREARPDPFEVRGGPRPAWELKVLLDQLHSAVREVGRSGSDTQVAAAAELLKDARKAVYLLLAEDAAPGDGKGE